MAGPPSDVEMLDAPTKPISDFDLASLFEEQSSPAPSHDTDSLFGEDPAETSSVTEDTFEAELLAEIKKSNAVEEEPQPRPQAAQSVIKSGLCLPRMTAASNNKTASANVTEFANTTTTPPPPQAPQYVIEKGLCLPAKPKPAALTTSASLQALHSTIKSPLYLPPKPKSATSSTPSTPPVDSANPSSNSSPNPPVHGKKRRREDDSEITPCPIKKHKSSAASSSKRCRPDDQDTAPSPDTAAPLRRKNKARQIDRWKCCYCGVVDSCKQREVFLSPSIKGLASHLERVHQVFAFNVKPVKCPWCDKRFGTPEEEAEHYNTKPLGKDKCANLCKGATTAAKKFWEVEGPMDDQDHADIFGWSESPRTSKIHYRFMSDILPLPSHMTETEFTFIEVKDGLRDVELEAALVRNDNDLEAVDRYMEENPEETARAFALMAVL